MDRNMGASLGLAALAMISVIGDAGAVSSRLGTEVLPVEQHIDLKLDANAEDYSGTVTIELNVVQSVSHFRLNAEDMKITSVELKRKRRSMALTHELLEHGQLAISTKKPLKPGSYELKITFENDYNESPYGLYKVEDEGMPFLFTQFEDDDARQAFPCFDEPEFKIPFKFTLQVPKEHLAISNGAESSRSTEGDWQVVHFNATPPVPSYALAIATGPFASVPIEGLSVPGNIYMTPGKEARAEYAITTVQPLLSALEGYFGSAYPYEKLDLISVPNFWPGAMENPGAITFKEGILLLDPERMTGQGKGRLTYIMAHELSHMWFGNLVTMKWWNDFWLNESFATWMGRKMRSQVYPELNSSHGLREILGAMDSDSKTSAKQVRVPVETNAFETTNWIVYPKGQAILQMFEQRMGEEKFQAGVRQYIENNRWSNATSDDLWKALSDASGENISEEMLTFLDQPGVPLVHFELTEAGIQLRQERMFIGPVEDRSFSPWHIPLTIRYKDGSGIHTAQTLFNSKEELWALESNGPIEWILPAVNGIGYYRWSLSEEQTKNLVANASEYLNETERIVLLNNLNALTQSGALTAGNMLELLAGFNEDSNPEVLNTVLELQGQYGGYSLSEELHPAYSAYLRASLSPILKRIGFEKKEGESDLTASLRANLIRRLAITGQDQEVITQALAMAERFLEDPMSLDPHMSQAVMDVYGHQGDASVQKMFIERVEASSNPNEKRIYARGIGLVQGEENKRNATDFAIKTALDGGLKALIFQSICLGGYDDMVLDIVIDSYDYIREHAGEPVLRYMPFHANGCSMERYEKAEAFFGAEENTAPGMEHSLKSTKQSVEACILNKEKWQPSLETYLSAFQ